MGAGSAGPLFFAERPAEPPPGLTVGLDSLLE
jgi:hypothetical protein